MCVCPVTSEELEDLLVENETVVLRNIAEELRAALPVEAMLSTEGLALQKVGGPRSRRLRHQRGTLSRFWIDFVLIDFNTNPSVTCPAPC